jgi:iron complex transport system substrate-binding protein
MITRISSPTRFALFAALTLVTALALAGPINATASKKRIVALTPFSANTLVNVGVKPAAIGAMAVGHKGISPKLKGIKQLALSHPNGPNMEQIAQIDPDVVLTSEAWKKGSQTMRDLAITVCEMDATSAGQVPSKLRALGYAYGTKKATDRLYRQTVKEINYAKSGRPIKKRPTVLMVLGVGRTPYVFLDNSWGGSVVKAAGGELLGSELKDKGGFVKVSDEYIVAKNPDVILAVPHGNASDIPSLSKFLQNNPAWSTTNAAQNKNVYVTIDDALLQPNIDVGDTIKRVRVAFLKNW